MRELKFRVWDKINNAWLKDWVGINNLGVVYDDGHGSDDLSLHGNATIQMYTGVHDKNGVEIYEGDIVKVKRYYLKPMRESASGVWSSGPDDLVELGEQIGKIFWADVFLRWQVSYEHVSYDDTEDLHDISHRYEVIGNEFENPEKLK